MKLNYKNLCLIIWTGIFCFLFLLLIHSYYYQYVKISLQKNDQQLQQLESVLRTNPNPSFPKDSLQQSIKSQKSSIIHDFTDTVVTDPTPSSETDQTHLESVKKPTLNNQPISLQPVLEEKPFSNLLQKQISWKEFVSMQFDRNYLKHLTSQQLKITQLIHSYQPNLCSNEIVHKLSIPRLPPSEVQWCKWALDPNGGQVVVGKSWGKLNNQKVKDRFDLNNCNAVNEGKNPSCDDSWGDAHIKYWLNHSVSSFSCEQSKSSQVNCFKNDNNDLYCEMFNAQIDFRKVQKIPRPGAATPSKKFEQNFLSTDCRSDITEYKDFSFPHLYSPKVSSSTCDVIYNGTLLLYSHDDIRNLGHTLNDIMNVWVMFWLAGIARYADKIDMLNIDSFKLGHNFDDEPNAFFSTYRKSMHDILKGITFANQRVCIKHLLIQNIPPRFFIWESWFVDLPCSFIGPSTLYQRWNLHLRAAWNLLSRPSNSFVRNDQKKLKILMIVRNEKSNMWGSQRTSRNYLNLPDAIESFKNYETNSRDNVEVVFQEMNKLSFEEQLQLISDTSIIIGAHGAGMASSMHMSVGSKYCCGMIELYPQGEFTPIKGHGNMARKMGIYYDRVDAASEKSLSNGFHIPVKPLLDAVEKMVQLLKSQPSCIHPEVMNNPYLELGHTNL